MGRISKQIFSVCSIWAWRQDNEGHHVIVGRACQVSSSSKQLCLSSVSWKVENGKERRRKHQSSANDLKTIAQEELQWNFLLADQAANILRRKMNKIGLAFQKLSAKRFPLNLGIHASSLKGNRVFSWFSRDSVLRITSERLIWSYLSFVPKCSSLDLLGESFVASSRAGDACRVISKRLGVFDVSFGPFWPFNSLSLTTIVPNGMRFPPGVVLS